MKRVQLTPSLAVAIAALVVAAAGGAYAASSHSAAAISACERHKGGALYVAKTCARQDKRLTWNVTGPPGPSTGAAGGDLTGSYPNPKITPGAVTDAKLAHPSLTITAGTGLAGGGAVALGGSGALSIDPKVVQDRVTGSCASGSAVASINQNGSVGCQSSVPIVYASSSGMADTLTTTIGGGSGQVAELPLDGANSTAATPSGAVIDVSGNSVDVAQTFPTAETITGITLYTSTTQADNAFGPVQFHATLYTSSAPNNAFMAAAPVTVSAAPALMTGLTPAGTVSTGSASGLSFQVAAGTRGMIVVSATTPAAPLANSVPVHVGVSLTAAG